MRIYAHLFFVLAFLFLGIKPLGASTILGKVVVYSSPSHPKVYPLISGNKITYDHKALIRIAGGTLIADKGTVLKALDEVGQTLFQIEEGNIYFRLKPEKARVSFKSKHGEIFSPKVVLASNSITSGRIVVRDNDTLVEVSEGVLKAVRSGGLTEINAGEKIILTQATIEEEAVGLEELIGKIGMANTVLNPEGAAQVEGKVLNVVVVDDDLEVIDEASLPEDTEIKVVGVSGSTLLVQPVDRELLAAFLPAAGAPIIGAFLGAAGAIVIPAAFAIPVALSQGEDGVVSPVTR
ncbi:MAG: hypothetical protein V3U58_08165 [Thermodesulfobacteriota bacterium]